MRVLYQSTISHNSADVQFGFLAHQFPSHIALTTHIVPAFDVIFNVGELLLEMAAVVHQAVLLLPPDVVLECEKRELQWEPVCEFSFGGGGGGGIFRAAALLLSRVI